MYYTRIEGQKNRALALLLLLRVSRVMQSSDILSDDCIGQNFFTQSYLSHNKSLLLLLLLLCGNVKVNPGPPDDIVKCVCSSTEESGLMLQCEQCSCWLHNECVNVPAHVADNYPFICPLCIKSSLSLISSLKSEISHLKAHIIELEKSSEFLSTQLSVLQPIKGSSISDITVKSTASSLNPSQTILSNSHPSKGNPISPNPAHLNTSNVHSNPSLPPNKPPHFLSKARPPRKPPHKQPLLPTPGPHYHQYPSTHKMPLLPTPQPPPLPSQFSHFHPPLQPPLHPLLTFPQYHPIDHPPPASLPQHFPPPQHQSSSLLSLSKTSTSSLTSCKSTSSQICHSSASFSSQSNCLSSFTSPGFNKQSSFSVANSIKSTSFFFKSSSLKILHFNTRSLLP